MSDPLRVLIVEDSESDTLLLLRELEKNGFDPTHRRVETAPGLTSALADEPWDIVLSDYRMPRFTGLDALKIVREKDLDLPFIIISGTIGEDVAVEAMKAGAHDYLMKGHLVRLGAAIRRELREARMRGDRKQAEEARRAAEERIKQLNLVLEERVRQRTFQLRASNKELESFAYAVSHDLRSPLRNIEGFSKMLEKELSDALDQRGNEFLQIILAEARRMSHLIDDLLRLSMVTRSEMHVESVDLSGMARGIVARLGQGELGRRVDVVIADDLKADGDSGLLRQMLENLLGNAWKFTGSRPGAEVEFGTEEQEGRAVYFVRDNGVGFDMTQAKRLFKPFQRLHTANEFPGSGVGLSTVRRIVGRHGGRVWAESEVDRGATFHFTLFEQGEDKDE